MARGRLISVNFWTDGKVEDEFTPEDKFGYLWCLTNPHTNLCGCYEISIKQMSNELGYNTDSVERLIKRLDRQHNVIRYSVATKELLVINWHRYNWSGSDKLDKPLLAEIRKVKNPKFRVYLADLYNGRETVAQPYDPGTEKKKEVVRYKYGEYGWVKLSDEEHERLLRDLGEADLTRCIEYVDRAAQKTGNKNKWKDWNLVIRECHRNGWGQHHGSTRQSASVEAMDALNQLHQMYEEEEA